MMIEEGSSPTTIPPFLIRNLIASIFVFADKSLVNLAQKSKLLQLIRYVLVTAFLFFLRLLPSFYPRFNTNNYNYYFKHHNKPPAATAIAIHDQYQFHIGGGGGSGDTAIGRALLQLLSLVNDIPVSSRKYQIVRSLAENLIDDNHREGVEALRQVNRTVLSAAFSKTLTQLEAAAVLEKGPNQHVDDGSSVGPAPVAVEENRLSRVLRAVRSIGDVAWIRGRASGSRSSAEKLAAEVLWLAEKLVACGYGDEAVGRWASASNLAWLSVSVEPRLQASLVKVSALLFKHAKTMRTDEADDDESKKKQEMKTKMQMLISWLPLLCRASNGTDVPILSIGERAELERVLEETIEMLEEEEDQEKVLSLWLHHFTYCSSSDWPNLRASYARWCNASRKLLDASPYN